MLWSPAASDPPGTGVAGGFELLHMGAGNQA